MDRRSVLAAALLWTGPAAAQDQVEVRTYAIHHALFGDIGALSDAIATEGQCTRVAARADVKVALLGLTLHQVRAEWSETWQGSFLMHVRATTTRNGSTTVISGEHEGGRFIVRSGGREFDAPADIHPVHPWSLRFVHAATLFSPESGEVFPARIANKGDASIRIGGVSRRVRHYVVSSDTTNHLYFDDEGTLVLAEYRDITGYVRFSLQSTARPHAASMQGRISARKDSTC